ncbi:MAG: hypothetical protein HY340_02950 [Candidatus Kerfeldbacteria bacterium]|nr:hypothetical protein [Candidatus Kerfeldbacteria bacterium]
MLQLLAVPLAASTDFLQTIDWTKPTWDLFIVLFFVVGAFLYGMSLGRDRIAVIMVAIYMALAVMKSAPDRIVVNDQFAIQISAFLGVFILLFFLLSRSALLRTIATVDSRGSWWQVFVFSVLHVGLLISVTLSFLPESAVERFTPFTRQVFTGEIGGFAWVVAPILFMMLVRGGGKEKKYKYDV